MNMQLSPQAAESLGKRALGIITERVDDGAFRIGQMVTRGVPDVLDRPLPRHGTPRGIRWGWTAVMGLASIVTEGDHRHVSVAPSLQGMPHPLSRLPAHVIAPLDVRDDRLRPRRQHVRKPASWHAIERALHARSLAMDDVAQAVLRGEATTVSGAHAVPAGGLGPCGQRNEDPTRPQSQGRRGS